MRISDWSSDVCSSDLFDRGVSPLGDGDEAAKASLGAAKELQRRISPQQVTPIEAEATERRLDWREGVGLVREAGDQELHASIIIFRSGSPPAPRPSEPHRRAGVEVAADHVTVRRKARKSGV